MEDSDSFRDVLAEYEVISSETVQKEPHDSSAEDKDDTKDRTAAAMAFEETKTDTEANSGAMDGHETDTENVTRILIIGKAGTGKSTVGNAILGKEMFPVVCGMQAGTVAVSVKREEGVEVIDTPDTEERSIDNTHFREILSPCLHAVLLTIRYNDCSKRDGDLYRHTLEVLGDHFPSNRLMLVFTFSDSMEDKKKSNLMQTEEKNITNLQSAMKRKMEEMEKISLKQVKENIPELRSIIDDERYVFFKTQGTNQQRQDILEMVAKLGTAPPDIGSKDIADVPAREIRVLIIGKGGTGKSTVGNILLGQRRFHVGSDTYPKMTTSSTASAVLQGRRIMVTDTPDLINADFSRQEIKDEILKWKSETMTKPHAILLTVRCHEPYSTAEYDMYTNLKEVWGDKDLFRARLILAFTFADPLGACVNKLFDDSPQLSSVFGESVGCKIIFNNPAIQEKSEQRDALIEIVEALDGMKERAPRPPVRQRGEYQAIIIGKTGTGKSTVGNFLLDEPGRFPVGCGMDSTTTEPDEKTIALPNDDLKVVDTQDLCNMDLEEQKMKDTVDTWKNKMLDASKPYAILLTVRCDRRYTAEEYAVYLKMKKLWGDSKLFSGRLIVVFTFGDRLDGKIEEELKTVCLELKQVLKDADWRYTVLNDCAVAEKKREQRETLFTMLKSLLVRKRRALQNGFAAHRKNMAESETLKEIRLIAIGKTGAGKSSAGNTIMGEEKFKPVRGWGSGTVTCDWKEIRRNGMWIQMTDTPGVCDTHRSQDDIHREISKCIGTVTPGPHAVLMVVKAGDRFTKEEQDAYEELKRLFGEELTKYMIVVFTGMDFLERDNIKLDVAMQKAPEKVREIVQEASGRYIGFNNEGPWDARRKQGDKLLAIVDQLIAENRGYYSNDLMKKFDQEVKKEAKGGATVEEVKKGIAQGENETFFAKVAGFFAAKGCTVM